MLAGATEVKEESTGTGESLKSVKQLKEEKAARQAELMQLVADGKDTISEEGAVRLNNATKKGATMVAN